MNEPKKMVYAYEVFTQDELDRGERTKTPKDLTYPKHAYSTLEVAKKQAEKEIREFEDDKNESMIWRREPCCNHWTEPNYALVRGKLAGLEVVVWGITILDEAE